jgi:hypothetical protein
MIKNDNLRLIGSAEEAQHIEESYRGARNVTLFFVLLVLHGVAVVMLDDVIFPVDGGQARPPFFQVYFGFSGLSIPFAAFFAIFYGTRMLRYVWYRRQHRACLRKYNRL